MATHGTVYNVCSKQPRDCNLVFLFINQQCMPKMFYRENVCSKQVRNYFLVYLSLISTVRLNVILQKMCSKQSRGLRISFLRYFLYTKNACSKQTGDIFLTYAATFLIQKMCVQNKRDLLFNLFSYLKIVFKTSTGLLFSF